MKIRHGLLLTLTGVALIAGCTGGVDSGPLPANSPTPTPSTSPSPTGTGNPTPTPPAGLQGEPWTTTASPAEDNCAFGTFILPYGNAGSAVVGIATTGSNLFFDVGLHLNAAIGVGDEPSGTVDGNGNFTQTYSYCIFNGASTFKMYASWAGTFSPTNDSFTDATLTMPAYFANGDLRSTCQTAITTADAPCTPALSYTIDGVKQ